MLCCNFHIKAVKHSHPSLSPVAPKHPYPIANITIPLVMKQTNEYHIFSQTPTQLWLGDFDLTKMMTTIIMIKLFLGIYVAVSVISSDVVVCCDFLIYVWELICKPFFFICLLSTFNVMKWVLFSKLYDLNEILQCQMSK